MIALLDGDILAYRCAFAAEKTKYLTYESHGVNLYDAHKDIPKGTPKECVWQRKEVEPEEFAVEATRATLQSILTKLGTNDYELYLSGAESFRERIAVTKKYKGNRDGLARPVHYEAVRAVLTQMGGIVCGEGLEADDLLGIRATELGDDSVIVSIDKDLLQIPGRHYNWVSDKHVTVGLRGGSLSLGCQILSGDPTDNVPGLPGIGQVKAEARLKDCSSNRDMLTRIREDYLAYAGGDQDSADRYLTEQGSLVYILRRYEDSFTKWMEKTLAA